MHETVKRHLARRSVDTAQARHLRRCEPQVRHLEVLRADAGKRLVMEAGSHLRSRTVLTCRRLIHDSRDPGLKNWSSFPGKEIRRRQKRRTVFRVSLRDGFHEAV